MHGGTIRESITVGENCVFNFSGGSIATDAPYYVFPTGILGYSSSVTNFLGTEFAVNGVRVDQLTAGMPFNLPSLNVTLSGRLADGHAFSFFLKQDDYSFSFPFSFFGGARVTLTLVHPGDYNGDSAVDAADYAFWRSNAGSEQPNLAADGNFDGVVDDADFAVWRQTLAEATQRRMPPCRRSRSQIRARYWSPSWQAHSRRGGYIRVANIRRTC